MQSAEIYLGKIATITGQPVTNNSITYTIAGHWDTPQQGRSLIASFRLKQKELGLLKKEIHMSMQELSKAYISSRVKVGKSVRSGFIRGLFGGKTVGKYNMLQRNSITTQKDQALRPYQQLLIDIDNIILAYEKQKLAIEENLIKK